MSLRSCPHSEEFYPEKIPDELWLDLCSWLAPKDLCALAQTCTKMRQLTASDCLWKPFIFHLEDPQPIDCKAQFAEAFISSKEQIHYLKASLAAIESMHQQLSEEHQQGILEPRCIKITLEITANFKKRKLDDIDAVYQKSLILLESSERTNSGKRLTRNGTVIL